MLRRVNPKSAARSTPSQRPPLLLSPIARGEGGEVDKAGAHRGRLPVDWVHAQVGQRSRDEHVRRVRLSVVQPKRDLFRRLDDLAPSAAILASNSSTIPISRMEDVTRRTDKVLNIHFYDPELIPMVDLMGGGGTSDQTMAIAERWVRQIDCVPIRLKKENLGFCMNHIWHTARIEALKMWADGVVDFQDIDRAWMVFLRLPFGLFGLMDRVGLDTVYNVHAFYYNETKDISQKPPDKLKEMIDRGELGEKTGKGFYSYPSPEYARPDFLKG